ncbi:DUF2155 domain-containing protein [Roseivivax sp. CAU 1761]
MEPGVMRGLRGLLAGLALAAAAALPGLAQEVTESGTGAEIRALDKLTGKVTDLSIAAASRKGVGRIEVEIAECRYPEGDPAGDAFAFLTVRELGKPDPAFRGWMIAAAPALNPMDHPRYDVWVLRCTTS